MFLIGESDKSAGDAEAREAAPDFRLAAELRHVLEQAFVRLNRVVSPPGKLLGATEADQQILVVELSRRLG